MRKAGRNTLAGTALAMVASGALSGCMVPVGPVSVSRFHVADTAPLGHGTIAVIAAPGVDPASLELQSYETAVATRLSALGYQVAPAAGARQLAEVRIARVTDAPAPTNPVRVGGGASTGSYGGGVGLGVSINLSGGPKPQTTSELGVVIRDAASHAVLWEGKALFTVAASSPLANTQLGAPKLAAALFSGFPGQSGETIQVP